MTIDWTVFILFNLFVAGMLALDLGVFHRRSHAVSTREALSWSGVWIGLALIFNLLIWLQPGWFFGSAHLQAAVAKGDLADGATISQLGALRAEQFLAGFLIEKALAVDNIFTIAAIFTLMAVPAAYQHKVLFYGIVGALIMRAVFIFAGVALIEQFSWIVAVFGAFLLWTGVKMALPHRPIDPANHWFMRACRRILPVTEGYREDRFVVREHGRWWVTPLFLVVLLVEFTDLVFAVDSIPAILAITDDVFIVYTSNVFAILGLRSLFFALAGMMDAFAYLKYALAGILIFVGVKLLLHMFAIKLPIELSLAVIGCLLAAGVVVSLLLRRRPASGAGA
jgi:tellurite resistance protein TerC